MDYEKLLDSLEECIDWNGDSPTAETWEFDRTRALAILKVVELEAIVHISPSKYSREKLSIARHEAGLEGKS